MPMPTEGFRIPPLSQRLQDAGVALAGMLTAGELGRISPDAKFQLTCLSLELGMYSEMAAALEEASRPRTAREMAGRVTRLRPALAVIEGGVG